MRWCPLMACLLPQEPCVTSACLTAVSSTERAKSSSSIGTGRICCSTQTFSGSPRRLCRVSIPTSPHHVRAFFSSCPCCGWLELSVRSGPCTRGDTLACRLMGTSERTERGWVPREVWGFACDQPLLLSAGPWPLSLFVILDLLTFAPFSSHALPCPLFYRPRLSCNTGDRVLLILPEKQNYLVCLGRSLPEVGGQQAEVAG